MTGNRYEDQVLAALRAVELRPPRAFLWFGRRETVSDDGDQRELLVARIARRLHRDFFSAGAPQPRRGGPVTAPDDGGAFVRALSQANGGHGAWQSDWRVAPAEDGDDDADGTVRVVRPDGLTLLAPAEAVAVEGEAAAGPSVRVRLPKELRGFSPGFYVALGDSAAPSGDDLVDLYWNISAAGAVTLVARLTYALNGAELPFSLQLLDNPARYARGDAVVLTLAQTDFAAAIKLVRPLLRSLGAHLADVPPAFTKPLARGLAVAEPPASGAGFGRHRCGLLAEAVVAAGEAGAATVEERLVAVRERLADAGVRLDAPFLRPRSAETYALS